MTTFDKENDMTLNFEYVNNKGEIKHRNVIVIHESQTKIAGFDLAALNQEEKDLVKSKFGKKPVTDFPTEKTSIDYEQLGISKEVFKKSYRLFNKVNIL